MTNIDFIIELIMLTLKDINIIFHNINFLFNVGIHVLRHEKIIGTDEQIRTQIEHILKFQGVICTLWNVQL